MDKSEILFLIVVVVLVASNIFSGSLGLSYEAKRVYLPRSLTGGIECPFEKDPPSTVILWSKGDHLFEHEDVDSKNSKPIFSQKKRRVTRFVEQGNSSDVDLRSTLPEPSQSRDSSEEEDFDLDGNNCANQSFLAPKASPTRRSVNDSPVARASREKKWKRRGEGVRVRVDRRGVLVIDDVSEADEGTYTCISYSNDGGRTSGDIQVFVRGQLFVPVGVFPVEIFSGWNKPSFRLHLFNFSVKVCSVHKYFKDKYLPEQTNRLCLQCVIAIKWEKKTRNCLRIFSFQFQPSILKRKPVFGAYFQNQAIVLGWLNSLHQSIDWLSTDSIKKLNWSKNSCANTHEKILKTCSALKIIKVTREQKEDSACEEVSLSHWSYLKDLRTIIERKRTWEILRGCVSFMKIERPGMASLSRKYFQKRWCEVSAGRMERWKELGGQKFQTEVTLLWV